MRLRATRDRERVGLLVERTRRKMNLTGSLRFIPEAMIT
jgi:hypothetical protein